MHKELRNFFILPDISITNIINKMFDSMFLAMDIINCTLEMIELFEH